MIVRVFAWISLVCLLLICGVWAMSSYKSPRIEYSNATRQFVLSAMPQAVVLEQFKPPASAGAWEFALDTPGSINFSITQNFITDNSPVYGLQTVRVFGNRGSVPVFVTVAMIRWWWVVIPLALLTAIAWAVQLSRRSKRSRGFEIEATSVASADASR